MEQQEENRSRKTYFEPMHTAEHLVNGAIARMLGCGRAFSTHIEKKKSKCDFHYSRNLTAEELSSIEREVNDQIASGAEVWDDARRGRRTLCPDPVTRGGDNGPDRSCRRVRCLSLYRGACLQYLRDTARGAHVERLGGRRFAGAVQICEIENRKRCG